MNHTIKGILIVVAITSMLFVGATMVPIVQNSFAHKKSDFKQAEGLPVLFPGVPGGNTNTNTNSADSTSSSSATADNTNNINNLVQAQLQQQQSLAPATSTSGGGSFGPNCVGCITTKNLANGAVTTQKIAPGAVSNTVQQVSGTTTSIPPGSDGQSTATCPSGSVVTGGGFEMSNGISQVFFEGSGLNGWIVDAKNPTGSTLDITALAECATIHP